LPSSADTCCRLASTRSAPAASYSVGVSRRSLVTIEGASYSVPCEWSGLDILAYVGAEDVEIVGPQGTRLVHPRKRFGERSIDYRHYVHELARKPQAVRQVAAELVPDLGEPFISAWRSLVDAHGPREAARIFAKVLTHVESRGLNTVATPLRTALDRGEPLLLTLPPAAAAPVLVALEALPQSLREVAAESGCAADYDRWLRGGVS
jgi:hypothetical protein